MPVMDGLEATRRIRGLETLHGLPRIRVVMMVAFSPGQDGQQWLRACGGDALLTKPIGIKALRRMVEDVIVEEAIRREPGILGLRPAGVGDAVGRLQMVRCHVAPGMMGRYGRRW